MQDVKKIINDLIKLVYANTCSHDETHRGGAIWTICSQCGEKWADDEGGMPVYETPEAIVNAEAYLGQIRPARQGDDTGDIVRSLRNASQNEILSPEWRNLLHAAANTIVTYRMLLPKEKSSE